MSLDNGNKDCIQRLSNHIKSWKRANFFTELWIADEGSKYATCAPGNSDGDCAGSSSSRQPREVPGSLKSGPQIMSDHSGQ